MSETLFNFINASYIVAGVLFILALAGLSKFETSKRGNAFGMVGMLIAIIATIVWLVRMPDYHPSSMLLLFIPMIIGGHPRLRPGEVSGTATGEKVNRMGHPPPGWE